jgi:hypothetical protein
VRLGPNKNVRWKQRLCVWDTPLKLMKNENNQYCHPPGTDRRDSVRSLKQVPWTLTVALGGSPWQTSKRRCNLQASREHVCKTSGSAHSCVQWQLTHEYSALATHYSNKTTYTNMVNPYNLVRQGPSPPFTDGETEAQRLKWSFTFTPSAHSKTGTWIRHSGALTNTIHHT